MANREFIDQQRKPVREIKPNTRSVTGTNNGQQFESTLERDLLTLMNWRHDVERCQVQPTTIPYDGPDDKPRSYTPDLLVVFKDSFKKSSPQPPMYCEAKFREDLIENWSEYKPKFKAAIRFAKRHGCRFKIFTEREIRTPYLDNVKFLFRYRTSECHAEYRDAIRQLLQTEGRASPIEIIRNIAFTREDRGRALWTLWCMVARDEIQFNEDEPLTQESELWIEI